jgi:hypothetical protein
MVPGIEKEIQLSSSNKNSLSITPSFYSSISSLNFYESVINRRLQGIKNSKIQTPSLGTIQSNTTVDKKGFKLLDFELSLPINLELDKWNINLTPTYAMPFNKVTTTSANTSVVNGISKTVIVNSTPYSENHLANIFFFDFGITYNF